MKPLKEGTGTLRPRKKGPTKSGSDWTGRTNINGDEYWLTAWWNEKDGDVWLNFRVGNRVEQQPAGYQQPQQPAQQPTQQYSNPQYRSSPGYNNPQYNNPQNDPDEPPF